MTPEQKIKATILLRLMEYSLAIPKQDINKENVDDIYERYQDDDSLTDARYEFRNSGEETDLPCDYSRHYESNSVAAQMFDGSWVGWTYWHGGGKWGEPEAIDWMSEAYFLNCVEEERTIVHREFTKADQ